MNIDSKLEDLKKSIKSRLYWDVAYGLEEISHLKPSFFLDGLINENIEGNLDIDEVEEYIDEFYSEKDLKKEIEDTDRIAVNIVKLLSEDNFKLDYNTFILYHKLIFKNTTTIIPNGEIGKIRKCYITKKEDILDGESIYYADYEDITIALEYEFNKEKEVDYRLLNTNQIIERLSDFTYKIWQIHPFRDGNTRTTAIYIQKYLEYIGIRYNASIFKYNSLYFRNALVRASYFNYRNNIAPDKSYLIKFFENLLMQKDNVLDNNELYINNNLKR